MDQDEFVIFAELNREAVERLLDELMNHYPQVQFGRQGDDWIWVHLPDGVIEIDTFFSNNLQVKGKANQLSSAAELLGRISPKLILEIFNPPIADLTR